MVQNYKPYHINICNTILYQNKTLPAAAAVATEAAVEPAAAPVIMDPAVAMAHKDGVVSQ